jgi:thioredoxin
MRRFFAGPLVAVTRRAASRRAVAALLAWAALVALAAPPCAAAGPSAPAEAERRVVPVSWLSFGSRVLAAQMPVLVDFSASWCAPCRQLEKALDEVVASAGGRVRVVRVNVGWSHGLAKRYGVEALPTLLLFDHGKVIDRVTGAMGAGDIRDMLANGTHPALIAALPAASAPSSR